MPSVFEKLIIRAFEIFSFFERFHLCIWKEQRLYFGEKNSRHFAEKSIEDSTFCINAHILPENACFFL